MMQLHWISLFFDICKCIHFSTYGFLEFFAKKHHSLSVTALKTDQTGPIKQ